MKRLLLAAAIAIGALAGCSSESAAPQASNGSGAASDEAPFELDAAPVDSTEVTAVKSYRFEPQVIEVATGSQVTWTNEDDFPHNVHFLTGNDETLDLPVGETTSFMFDDAGDFYYECSIHPQQMRGMVIVED
jgi:plastocyanin